MSVSTVQPALPQPERSCRPKTSVRTTIRHQNHMTQKKNTIMVQRMSMKG